MTTIDKIRNIIADRMAIDAQRIKPDTNPVMDLGADSLDLAELIMDIEDAFGLRSADMPDPMPSTVGAIAAAVDHILAHKTPK